MNKDKKMKRYTKLFSCFQGFQYDSGLFEGRIKKKRRTNVRNMGGAERGVCEYKRGRSSDNGLQKAIPVRKMRGSETTRQDMAAPLGGGKNLCQFH